MGRRGVGGGQELPPPAAHRARLVPVGAIGPSVTVIASALYNSSARSMLGRYPRRRAERVPRWPGLAGRFRRVLSLKFAFDHENAFIARDDPVAGVPIQYLFQRVEKEVAKFYPDVPESIRLKTLELRSAERKVANFVDFVAPGRGTDAVGRVLAEVEALVDRLEEELAGLRRVGDGVRQAPPIEWIQERVSKVKTVLSRRTPVSALLLRDLLGPIRLDRVMGFRPACYRARTSMNVLACWRIQTPKKTRTVVRSLRVGGGGGSRTRVREYVPTGLYMLVRACCFATRVRARPKPRAAERRKISLRPVVAPGRSQPAE